MGALLSSLVQLTCDFKRRALILYLCICWGRIQCSYIMYMKMYKCLT